MGIDFSLNKYVDSIFYGGTRAVCVNTLLYPLEVIKTHQQTHQNQERIFQVIQRIWQQKGPVGFFHGLSAQLSKSTLRQTWTWPMVMGIPHFLSQHEMATFPKYLITALCISTIDATITTPIEKRRVLAITSDKKTSLLSLFKPGSKGWSGFNAHWSKLSVRWSAFLNAQDYFREKERRQSNSKKLSYLQLIKAGTQVAFVVSLACAPFDVANTLKQSSERSFWKNSSLRSSFRGWPMTATSMIVHNVASVILMEKLGAKFNKPA